MLLAICPLAAAGLALSDTPMLAWLWGLLTATSALVMLLPALTQRQSLAKQRPAGWWTVPLAVGAVCMALLPWIALATTRAPLAAVACVWALVAAGVLAPWPPAVLAVAWVPMVAATGAAAAIPLRQAGVTAEPALPALAWLLVGAGASTAALALALARRRLWKNSERRLMALQSRSLDLEAERDQALRNDQDKGRFVAIASHDLRQPVHALGLFAATLQRRLRDTPDEALVRNFLRAVDDLERSFSAMLDIARLDGGALTPTLRTFPLRDLYRRLHMQHAGQAELSGLGLRFSTGGKSVTSDPQLLERVIGNLVQNAIKYTAKGGVVVVSRSTATHLNIEVWDTGIGMAEAELPRVFEEFYQAGHGKRDRSHGLGMGLAIVKRLTELLGHRLEVASRPGSGSMFRVGIPIGTLPGIQDDLAPADTLPMAAELSQMVLIVDDEEPIREGLRMLLQEWGYQTLTAANAAEAEAAVLALEGRVDLVLSDLQLDTEGEEPDGRDVIDAVRRLCGWRVPAVVVTGDTSHQALALLLDAGDPVLFKPVQPRRLFEAMRSVLR